MPYIDFSEDWDEIRCDQNTLDNALDNLRNTLIVNYPSIYEATDEETLELASQLIQKYFAQAPTIPQAS